MMKTSKSIAAMQAIIFALCWFNFGMIAAKANVWTPTDGDMNALLADNEGNVTGVFAIVEPDNLNGWKLPFAGLVGGVAFSANDIAVNYDETLGYMAVNTENSSIILGESPEFSIAYFDGDTWSFADHIENIGRNTEYFQWDTFDVGPVVEGVVPLAPVETGHIDLVVADIAAPQAVPIPAAAWLFFSGLVGMVGVARRRG